MSYRVVIVPRARRDVTVLHVRSSDRGPLAADDLT
jgi:hypothetical protein